MQDDSNLNKWILIKYMKQGVEFDTEEIMGDEIDEAAFIALFDLCVGDTRCPPSGGAFEVIALNKERDRVYEILVKEQVVGK